MITILNRLTKTFTVSCRGKANEELSRYGNVFSIIPHPNKDGLFILNGDKQPTPEILDENVSIEESDIPDFDITELVDCKDEEVKEIDSFDFNLD